jgi:hypothetical protein
MKYIQYLFKTVGSRGIHVMVLTLAILTMSVKCKHSNEYIGPEYKLVPEGFTVSGFVTNPAPAVNFLTDSVKFVSNFSSRVTWFIDLKGLSSGAQKRLTGVSSSLTGDVNATWNGGHDGTYFFSLEQVEATLSFMGTSLTLKDTITISQKKKYNDLIGAGGLPITDFEYATPLPPGIWYTFADGPSGGPFESDSNRIGSSVKAVEGTRYFQMKGIDVAGAGHKNYYIQGVGFQVGSPMIATYSNPDSVYFNVYVYGFGVSNTKFQISFDEDDNGNNNWGNDLEDEFIYAVKVDWIGWKLVSFKYSDAVISTEPPNGTQGNKVQEPHKVVKMGFVLLTDPPLNPANVLFDFPTFSYGHPFDPNN